jgi:hypothetical protein
MKQCIKLAAADEEIDRYSSADQRHDIAKVLAGYIYTVRQKRLD